MYMCVRVYNNYYRPVQADMNFYYAHVHGKRTESFPSVMVGWVAPLVCVADNC